MKKLSILIFLCLGLFISRTLIAQHEIQSIYLQNPDAIIPFILTSADFWKKSVDWEDGGFYSEVKQDGTPELTFRKSFVQCSRHAYGFSRAFMVTGDEEYLDYAENAIQFVYDYGWDKENGGWFFSSNKSGSLSPPYGGSWDPNNKKWSFQQHYDVLGIGAMAEATRSPLHLDWLNLASHFNDSLLWDHRPNYSGYYDNAELNWSNPSGKGFTPTVDAITTWVLAKALLTDTAEDKDRLLVLADNIVDHLYESMLLPQVNLGFAELYSSNWVLNPSSQNASSGHVIKTAWCLARAYMINPRDEYLVAAQYMIDDMMNNGGYDYENGGLYSDINWKTGTVLPDKNHWMLEQGVTSGLINYFLATDPIDRDLNLSMADGCLDFYMNHFIDKEYGECYIATNAKGRVINKDKSDPFKGGYHNIELAYLVYVYGNLFLHEKPVSLYYRFEKNTEQRQFKMTPLAITDNLLKISEIQLNDAVYTNYNSDKRTLTIPSDIGGIFKITYDLKKESVATSTLEDKPLVKVFPNPSREFVYLDNIASEAAVKIFNMGGQLVRSYKNVTNGQPLDIKILPSGLYLIEVQTKNQIVQKKIVKQ